MVKIPLKQFGTNLTPEVGAVGGGRAIFSDPNKEAQLVEAKHRIASIQPSTAIINATYGTMQALNNTSKLLEQRRLRIEQEQQRDIETQLAEIEVDLAEQYTQMIRKKDFDLLKWEEMVDRPYVQLYNSLTPKQRDRNKKVFIQAQGAFTQMGNEEDLRRFKEIENSKILSQALDTEDNFYQFTHDFLKNPDAIWDEKEMLKVADENYYNMLNVLGDKNSDTAKRMHNNMKKHIRNITNSLERGDPDDETEKEFFNGMRIIMEDTLLEELTEASRSNQPLNEEYWLIRVDNLAKQIGELPGSSGLEDEAKSRRLMRREVQRLVDIQEDKGFAIAETIVTEIEREAKALNDIEIKKYADNVTTLIKNNDEEQSAELITQELELHRDALLEKGGFTKEQRAGIDKIHNKAFE